MRANPVPSVLTVACATLLVASCDEPTTSPQGRPGANAVPTASSREASPRAPLVAAAEIVAPAGAPFEIRAPLEPFFINQAPLFMLRSHAPADLILQRLVARPGVGPWHTHPGPSFGIVERGQVMLTRYTKRGCTSEVYGPGEAYYEVANEVHRVTYLGTADAVEYKVRFNTPVGAPFRAPADDPGCGAARGPRR
jgi:hypothetical protein